MSSRVPSFVDDGAAVTADLSRTAFVQPEDIVRVACDAARLRPTSGGRLRFIAPTRADVANYLSRMGVKALLDQLGVRHDLKASGVRPTRDRFVELRSIGGDVHTIVPFWRLLITQLRGPFVQDLLTSIGEVVENVLDHSGADGFMCAQTYDGASVVRLAIGDFGVGVRRTLERAGRAYASDADAIIDATRSQTTSATDSIRGYGLHYLRRDVASTRAGRLTITSGHSAVTFIGDDVQPRHSVTPLMHGTLVEAHLPIGGKS